MTDQPTPDQQQAQVEVQQLLSNVQTQALYQALVEARAEIAGLRRQLADTQAGQQGDRDETG